jgi:hypothetical protein
LLRSGSLLGSIRHSTASCHKQEVYTAGTAGASISGNHRYRFDVLVASPIRTRPGSVNWLA